ncbi:MAG: hypothetical protein EPN17_17420 [Methylobacter sp.]|nr:MAG: hypothetical protein EPN17_17420 [Methylobacter sp.]
MIQQVNLYQDILKPGKNKSTVNLSWLGLSAIVLLFIGLSVKLTSNTQNIETRVQQLRKNLVAEQSRIKLISSKIPKQEIDTQLAAEVAQWQNMLGELTQTYQLLSGRSADQSPGFSNYLLALSKQSIPEVWLRELYIDEQQQIINIEGSTFKPDKIPYFLQQLQKEPIFNGRSFAKLIMQKSKEIPDQIDFKLSTTLEAIDKKDHAQ